MGYKFYYRKTSDVFHTPKRLSFYFDFLSDYVTLIFHTFFVSNIHYTCALKGSSGRLTDGTESQVLRKNFMREQHAERHTVAYTCIGVLLCASPFFHKVRMMSMSQGV